MKKYIAFEGIDGTGKTTLSKKFAERINADWTYEPNGETEELALLRKISLDTRFHISPETREMLLIDNRLIHHNTLVKPKLQKNIVVTDRSFMSGLVYAKLHGYSFDESFKKMLKFGINIFPDIIIFCNTAEKKIAKRDYDIYDNAGDEVMSQLENNFKEVFEFLKNHKIIHFYNDFSKNVDTNVDNLLKLLHSNGGYL